LMMWSRNRGSKVSSWSRGKK